MRNHLEYNIRATNRDINRLWQEFCKKLLPCIAKQSEAIKKQVDEFCAQQKSTNSRSPAQEALNHVAELKKEVQS